MNAHVRRWLRWNASALAVAATLVACSGGTEERPPPATDPVPPAPTSTTTVPPDGGPPDEPPPVNGDCSEGVQLGTDVEQLAFELPAPTPAGGTIAPGTYVLKELRAYGNVLSPGSKTGLVGVYTLHVGEDEITIIGDRVVGSLAADQRTESQTQEYTASGTELAFRLVCPPSAIFQERVDYTATPTELLFFKNNADVEVFEKR